MKSGPTVLKSKWSVHLQGLQERWGNTARARGLPGVKAGCGAEELRTGVKGVAGDQEEGSELRMPSSVRQSPGPKFSCHSPHKITEGHRARQEALSLGRRKVKLSGTHRLHSTIWRPFPQYYDTCIMGRKWSRGTAILETLFRSLQVFSRVQGSSSIHGNENLRQDERACPVPEDTRHIPQVFYRVFLCHWDFNSGILGLWTSERSYHPSLLNRYSVLHKPTRHKQRAESNLVWVLL